MKPILFQTQQGGYEDRVPDRQPFAVMLQMMLTLGFQETDVMAIFPLGLQSWAW